MRLKEAGRIKRPELADVMPMLTVVHCGEGPPVGLRCHLDATPSATPWLVCGVAAAML
jgi:hypothetical protein